jgi:hypothetical protein
MRGNLVVLLSGLMLLAILLPLVAFYLCALAFYIVVVNPLGHVYRIVRYGIQSEGFDFA